MTSDRRSFLLTTTALGLGAVALNQAELRADERSRDEPAEEVGATEDLMREHVILNRVLLIYEEGLRRLRASEEASPDTFLRSANLVRKFVEEYHERLEEKFIFPVFEQHRQLTDLVQVLKAQHEAGRRLTAHTLKHADKITTTKAMPGRRSSAHAKLLSGSIGHTEAREDTVLFPALRKLVPGTRLKELGEQFEQLYDYFGVSVVIVATCFSSLFAPLLFMPNR